MSSPKTILHFPTAVPSGFSNYYMPKKSAGPLSGVQAEHIPAKFADSSQEEKDRQALAVKLAEKKYARNRVISGELGFLDFEGAEVTHSDFSGARFGYIDDAFFSCVSFEKAQFPVYMKNVTFSRANFKNTVFGEDCTLYNVRFDSCGFEGAYFVGASYNTGGKFQRNKTVTYRSSKLLARVSRVQDDRSSVSGYDFYFFKGYRSGSNFVKAGCRVFTIAEYRKHIKLNKAYGHCKRKEMLTLEILRYFERAAAADRALTGKKS